jgi:hypothetical protein
MAGTITPTSTIHPVASVIGGYAANNSSVVSDVKGVMGNTNVKIMIAVFIVSAWTVLAILIIRSVNRNKYPKHDLEDDEVKEVGEVKP